MNRDAYQNPLITRYASRDMSRIFSDNFKFRTWRRLWLLLAEAEQELGLSITDEQLEEMREHLDDIDFEYAAKKEEELRHDVMAHIHAFGKAAPSAMSIIHLGATSAFVGDNTDLIQAKEGLLLVKKRLLKVMKNLREFSCEYREMPTLVHPFSAGPVDDSGKARGTVAPGPLDGLQAGGVAGLPAPGPGRQGNHRHPGQLPEIV